ncbi:hypothetical protein HK102_004448 [Quaeritorhiza haematococci]|nr:hypothetical protein HK102_004448 [Quaeritorhiza haematococci]
MTRFLHLGEHQIQKQQVVGVLAAEQHVEHDDKVNFREVACKAFGQNALSAEDERFAEPSLNDLQVDDRGKTVFSGGNPLIPVQVTEFLADKVELDVDLGDLRDRGSTERALPQSDTLVAQSMSAKQSGWGCEEISAHRTLEISAEKLLDERVTHHHHFVGEPPQNSELLKAMDKNSMMEEGLAIVDEKLQPSGAVEKKCFRPESLMLRRVDSTGVKMA